MANRIGRPTKEELEARMQMEYDPNVVIQNEGSLIYGNPYTLYEDTFILCLRSKLANSFGGPISPILMNFGLNNYYWKTTTFYKQYNSATNIKDIMLASAVKEISEDFVDNCNNVEYDNDDFKNNGPLAYYFTMKLDLRKINHNWSIVYQIVSDIHYKLFGYFLGVYLFEMPFYDRDPVARLHIFISTTGAGCPRNLVAAMNGNFSKMCIDAKNIVNNIYTTFTVPNHPNNIPVVPVFIQDPVSLELPLITEDSPGTYSDNYYEVYGPYIFETTPDPIVNCSKNLLRYENFDSLNRRATGVNSSIFHSLL